MLKKITLSASALLAAASLATPASAADLPTIGADTVRHAAEAGLNGIAVEAGQSLILDRAEVVAEANRLGLYVAGIKA